MLDSVVNTPAAGLAPELAAASSTGRTPVPAVARSLFDPLSPIMAMRAALAEPPMPDAVTASATAATPPSAAASPPSYFVRLGKLSATVRERALEHSLLRAREARDATYNTAAQITSTLDLLESTQGTLGKAGQQIAGAPELLVQRWKEWKERQAAAAAAVGGAGQLEEEEEEEKKMGADAAVGGTQEVGVLGQVKVCIQ
ncbi:hypothetical protein CRUP_022946 [Coryphaenoides rupestris]|nr:hypothetical protein CRUP_022946 [Coryphaenoides rupestris]